jgi:Zn-dependent metalloprotease
MTTNKHYLCLLLPFSIALGWSFNAAADAPGANSLRAFKVASGSDVVAVRGASGYVSQLRMSTLPTAVTNTAARDKRALSFFVANRDLFLDANTPLDLSTVRVSSVDIDGTSHVRLQQSFKGIPVRGGEAIAHLNNVGVTSVESRLLAELSSIDTAPKITAIAATAAARVVVNQQHKNATANFSVPQLEIINAERLRGSQLGVSRLAWLVDATGGPDKSIWIDAHNGRVILQVSRLAHVMARDVEDFRGNCTDVINGGNSDSYIDGGNVPTIVGDALSAWNNAKIIYDYFLTLGRDGLDGTDGSNGVYTGRGTFVVNVCNADFVRPVGAPVLDETTAWDRIALWDRSVPDRMKFSAGMAAADDVIAHEYTHALAAYLMPNASSEPYGFFLAGQSGALAEAFADIFGQVVDLSTNADTTASRWDIGEAAGAPFRNLMDPNLHAQPGKVTDTNYYCGADDDVAIHVNSGVLSHAFALAVDGGTYNGTTVAGIGLDKAARVFYRALSAHMLSTSSFDSAYNALLTAADELVAAGTLIAADATAITNALTAVELQVNPCSFGKLAYCPTGQVKTDLFKDGFENPASGKWTNSAIVGVNHWNSGSDVSGISRPTAADVSITDDDSKALSGNYALWADNRRTAGDQTRLGDSVVTMAGAISLPKQELGEVYLQFEHKFDFESTYDTVAGDPDGGVIEYSVDGGTTWIDARPLISDGRSYENFLQNDQGNPLAGPVGTERWAFVHNTLSSVTAKLEYVSTRLSLKTLAGQSVKFRFRMGTDRFTSRLGWMIDDVDIYTCGQVIATPTSGLELSENGGSATFTVQLIAAPSPSSPVTLALASSDETEGTVSPSLLTFDSTNWYVPQTVTVTSVDDGDVDGSIPFFINITLQSNPDDANYKIAVAISNTDNDVAPAPAPAPRKRKGGAWDVFSILVMSGFMWGARRRRSVLARRN